MANSKRKKLTEKDKRPLSKHSFQKLSTIFQFILKHKGKFYLGMVALLFSSVTLMAFPFLTGKLVDVASGKEWVVSSVTHVAVALLAILVIQAVFSFLRVYLFAQVIERSIADLRKSIFSNIIDLPMRFFDANRVGELTSRITSDVSTLQETFSTTLAEFFRQIVTLILGIGVLFYVTPRLTGFMLAIVPVLIAGAFIFGKYIRKLSKSTQNKLADANIVVEETLQGINTVKTFTNELFEKNRYGAALNEVVSVALKGAVHRSAFISFIILTMFGGIVVIIWYGAVLVQSGDLTVGDLLSFVIYTAFIGGSIAGLGDIYGQIQRAIGASERLLEIMDEPGEHNENTYESIKLQGNIKFDNVSFAYPTRKDIDVLKNLSLEITSGQKVALVGASGAGKSTIIQLLSGFYKGHRGSILVDSEEIEAYNLKAYRENIGTVPQEVALFGGTISENILYGKPSASLEEIKEASKKANAYEFVTNFPEGFDTIVGERGVQLSGGQRQRIAIARAILKDPNILILDEATSSLDAESEVAVQEALNSLMKNRTTIIIAHRLSTIRQVDKIFVIKDGQIEEQGDHEELARKDKGLYSNLLKLQFQQN